MLNKQISYTSKSYNMGKAFLYAFPIYISLTLLVIYIGKLLMMPKFGVVAWIILTIIPFLFQKKFKRSFTRKTILDFNPDAFKVAEYDLQNEELRNESIYEWDKIKAYNCYFSASSVTFITLYLRDGSSKNLSFNDKDQKTAIMEESVFSLFYSFITEYNLNKDTDNKIVFRPGFFTTNAGLTLIVSLLIVAIILIIIHFIFHPKSAMMSLAGLFIILGLFGKRKKDLMFKDRLANLEPIKF